MRETTQRALWLRLLGEQWCAFSDFHAFLPELREAFGTERPCVEMMTLEEQKQLAALPESFLVYRGCRVGEQGGICWSLDLEVAMQFPYRDRDRSAADSEIVTGEVLRSKVIALKLDSDESEVISFDVLEIDREPLVEV